MEEPNLIYVDNKQLMRVTVDELAEHLLSHPDVVTRVLLSKNNLTDKVGVKFAQYVAASSTVQCLGLSNNHIGEETYEALAAALRFNTSIKYLHLYSDKTLDRPKINIAFVEALRFNPNRSTKSTWKLYSVEQNEFVAIHEAATALGPPSMLAQLDFAQDCLPSTKIRK